MKFLIQTINGEIKHDFSFALIQAIEYQNWYRNSQDLLYIKSEDILLKDYIPIGSVEFVSNYINNYFNKTPIPRNVPTQLFKFANRLIMNGTEENIKDKELSIFVKSNDKIKSFTEIIDSSYNLPKGNYQISELIDILSEWRVFIHKGKLVGLQNYCGDFTIFPSIKVIEEMINIFTESPITYTLDVGINDSGTFVLEVHDFFSCGLYGFNDSRILPQMFNDWFKEYINE